MYGECDWLAEEDMAVDQSTPTEVSKKGEVTTGQPQLVIDRDIKNLCRPLNDEEYRLLKQDIKKHGCRDRITCWKDPKGRIVILDGHHRYKICTRHGIHYDLNFLERETKEEAIKWVTENHLARRNLSPMEAAYLRGTLYNMEKKAPGKSSESTLHQNDGVPGETAERLAPKMGVSPATMERDGILAKSIDKLRDVAGDELSMKIRGGDVKVPRKKIIELSEKPPEEVKAIAEQLEQGKKFAEAERIVNPTAETAPIDKNIHRIEDHLCKIHKILSKMEATTEPAKLEELLATIQQIRERIMEIGGSSTDHSSDDDETGPDPEPQEANEIIPGKDERAEPEEHPEESDQIIPDKDDRAASEEHPEGSDPIIPEEDEGDEAEDEPEESDDDPYGDEDEEAEFDGYGTDLHDYYTPDDVDPAE